MLVGKFGIILMKWGRMFVGKCMGDIHELKAKRLLYELRD